MTYYTVYVPYTHPGIKAAHRVLEELATHFGGATMCIVCGHGLWTNEGRVEFDHIIKLECAAPDAPEITLYFRSLKKLLAEELCQTEIFVTASPVTII